MSGKVTKSWRERLEEDTRLSETVRDRLRGMIKDAVAELNGVLGEGYVFFSECQAGFYGLYIRQPVCEPYRQELLAPNDVEGLADAVLFLHSMIEGGVKV